VSAGHEIVLDGCRTQPLGSYLQGLGVWRAVGRLADPNAKARWVGGRLVLTSRLDADGLVDVFSRRFEPLPIVAPWNSGSGFAGNGKSREAENALAAVLGSDDDRLAALREAIRIGFLIVERGRRRGWGGKGEELWGKASKPLVIQLCRNLLPDECLAWLDTAVATTQTSSGDPHLEFNRLLGTGGNLGRLDLQSTYIQRALTVLLDSKARKQNAGWLRGVLFGQEGTAYLRLPVGQFDPGRAGGIQSSPAEKADDDGFANPWAFLLTIEGALFFSGAAVRRHGMRNVGMSLPYVVRASQVGYGSAASQENAMAEIWTPQWSRPAALTEIQQMFGEARADWNGGAARNGLDLARAIASGGVDRGIDRFDRTAIVERHGQNPLAVPVGSITVRHRYGGGLYTDLDRWLGRLSRVNAATPLPEAVRAAVRQVEAALFETAAQDGVSLQGVLVTVARLHRLVARSGRVRAELPPLVLHGPTQWIDTICGDDGPRFTELRLAAALASGSGPGPQRPQDAPRPSQAMQTTPPLRLALAPVTVDERRPPNRQHLEWSAQAPVASGPDIYTALAAAHQRRAQARLPDPADAADPLVLPAVRGTLTAFTNAGQARLDDLAALVSGQVRGGHDSPDRAFDQDLFADLLDGLLLFGWTRADRQPRDPGHRGNLKAAPAPPYLALLVAFYGVDPLLVRLRDADPDDHRILLRPAAAWLTQLNAGLVARVVDDAGRRLRIAGAQIGAVVAPEYDTTLGRRLATALLIPVSNRDRRAALVRTIAVPTPSRASRLTVNLSEGVPA
jgi:CRISPR-associated protein Csx17